MRRQEPNIAVDSRFMTFSIRACAAGRKVGAPAGCAVVSRMGVRQATILALAGLVLMVIFAGRWPATTLLAAAQPPAPATEPAQATTPTVHQAQPPAEGAARHEPPAEGHGAEGKAEGEHEGGAGVWQLVAKLVNFAILVGTLVYFLRGPIGTYLRDRGVQIRSDLVKAADMKTAAAAQIDAIDRRLTALPEELAALKARGVEEIAAEEARIDRQAEAERQRLLKQARREIESQLKIAQRDLLEHAADLAVAVATARIKLTITDADQLRLVDRYLEQVGKK
jgi:F-type H+-transporting ATPase subunit b